MSMQGDTVFRTILCYISFWLLRMSVQSPPSFNTLYYFVPACFISWILWGKLDLSIFIVVGFLVLVLPSLMTQPGVKEAYQAFA